jgi:hypothetical protein
MAVACPGFLRTADGASLCVTHHACLQGHIESINQRESLHREQNADKTLEISYEIPILNGETAGGISGGSTNRFPARTYMPGP